MPVLMIPMPSLMASRATSWAQPGGAVGVKLELFAADVGLNGGNDGLHAVGRQQSAGVLEHDAEGIEGEGLPRSFGVVGIGVTGRDRVNEVDEGLHADSLGNLDLPLPPHILVPLLRDSGLPDAIGKHPLDVQVVHRVRGYVEGTEPAGDRAQGSLGDLLADQAYASPGVFLQLADALPSIDGRQLDGLEAASVEAPGDWQDPLGAGIVGPEALVAVPDGGVYKADFSHGLLGKFKRGASSLAAFIRRAYMASSSVRRARSSSV